MDEVTRGKKKEWNRIKALQNQILLKSRGGAALIIENLFTEPLALKKIYIAPVQISTIEIPILLNSLAVF